MFHVHHRQVSQLCLVCAGLELLSLSAGLNVLKRKTDLKIKQAQTKLF